ncbi:replication-relaxation family protein [Streptomyces kaniharaensis]|uniref:replication-relaxation family protein n=1 Tax=Streptomyces kaniharaensis TaxID=212423 RepID=UPI0018A8801E|nr:replication-relaxation family protein [Streptomyces kaniharaensis]
MTTKDSPAPAGQFEYLALASLHLHRSATTAQLQALVAPDTDISIVRRRLRKLHKQGLIDFTDISEPRNAHLYYLTEAGRALAAKIPEVGDRTSPQQNFDAIGVRLLLPHTQAVLRTHLAFLADARERDDSYGPLDWTPEVSHRWSDRKADEVRADALLRYTARRAGGRAHFRAMVEVDRATYGSERLTTKLTAYARFYELTPTPVGRRGTIEAAQAAEPVYKDFYPRFPRLLFVLDHDSRTRMLHRIEDLQIAAADNLRVANMLKEVKAGAALLEDLVATEDNPAARPSAPVWTSLNDPDRPTCSWMDL